MAKWVTWVEQEYSEPAAVPVQLQQHLRELWLLGETVEALAAAVNLPVEWVELFVRSDPPVTPKQ